MTPMTDMSKRILRLFRTYTVLDSALVARALGINSSQASSNLGNLCKCARLARHHARNARRPYVSTAYTLPGGTP